MYFKVKYFHDNFACASFGSLMLQFTLISSSTSLSPALPHIYPSNFNRLIGGRVAEAAV